ncbi:hypothetical protein P4O66_007793 [Electrophorus voltai]|uniref:Uncharacterized protein n=1 Tax=Electrophorus voltai TaxID=2609070 RepID=A0AAD8ZFY4_9TELE|nr:hypothetical protein P4O66_007793 [Electrophorus voltai]
MSDSEAAAPAETPVPAACKTIKADLDKCIKEKGEVACSKLVEAFTACVKSSAKTS